MRKLIILDFSHTSARLLFTAINNTKPKKINGKLVTSDFLPYYKHLLFTQLAYIKNTFKGELVLAIDDKNNWRKDIYPLYKSSRSKNRDESDINYNEFYPEVDKILETINDKFPFKVIKVPRAEADDVAGCLCKIFNSDREIVLVTSDHDWQQEIVDNHNVKMYNPIDKVYIKPDDFMYDVIDTPEGKMSRFTAVHCLLGDSGDEVPNIHYETVFSNQFISYLKENNISSTDVLEVTKLPSYKKLTEKYTKYKLITRGNKKGTYSEEKDIFKDIPYGIKTAIKDTYKLDEVLSSKILLDNFSRNNKLVNFDLIPDYIMQEVKDRYNEASESYCISEITDYFLNEGLGSLVNQVNKFHDMSIKQKETSLDDWF